jgi:branched-chain amino acid transport system permease protein
VAVWAVTTLLAGLAGVLLAPIVGLSAQDYTLLVSATFAAILVGQFTHLGRAIVVAFALGIVGAILQGQLPTQSAVSADVIESVPFIIILGFLISQVRFGKVGGATSTNRGILDRAEQRWHAAPRTRGHW